MRMRRKDTNQSSIFQLIRIWRLRQMNSPLDVRIYNSLVVMAIGIVILTVFQNLFLGLNGWNNLITFASLGILFPLFFLGNRNRFSTASRIVFLFYAYSALIAIWIINGGFSGPVPIFFFAVLFFSMFFLEKHRTLSLWLNFISVSIAVGTEWIHPEIIVPYPDHSTHVMDWFFSYGILSIGVFMISKLITDSYRREGDVIRSQKERLESLNDRLSAMAHTDSLIGIGNRRWFIGELEKRVRKANHNDEIFTFMLLDIDHFKKINDRYGHSAGDEVLKSFARVVEGILRQEDIFGRLGGEEFGIILGETDRDHIQRISRRLLEVVQNMRVVTPGHTIEKTTISMGVRIYDKNQTLEELYEKTDRLLYQAKDEGRNRFILDWEVGEEKK